MAGPTYIHQLCKQYKLSTDINTIPKSHIFWTLLICKIGLQNFAYHVEKEQLLRIAAYESLDTIHGTKKELLDSIAAEPKARHLCIKHLLSQRPVDDLVQDQLIIQYKVNTRCQTFT